MQDYESFYESEIQLRRLQMTPPFADIIALTASGQDENAVLRCCTDIRSIPAVYFFKDGKPVDLSVGLVPEEVLDEKIKALL